MQIELESLKHWNPIDITVLPLLSYNVLQIAKVFFHSSNHPLNAHENIDNLFINFKNNMDH